MNAYAFCVLIKYQHVNQGGNRTILVDVAVKTVPLCLSALAFDFFEANDNNDKKTISKAKMIIKINTSTNMVNS